MNKKVIFMAAAMLVPASITLGNWGTIAEDTFDATDIGFTALVKNPVDVAADNSQRVRDVDITTLPAVTPTAPAGSNGRVLKTEVNARDNAPQALHQSFATGFDDHAVETRLMPFIADGQTAATTEFIGVAVRATDYDNGYFFELRTDYSPTFGSYINFVRKDAGTATILGRIFFETGSNYGTVTFDAGKPIVRDPEARATNTWVTLRVEVVGNNIKAYVDGSVSPAIDYTDPAPPAVSQNVMIFHTDPFASTTAGVDKVLGLFDYFLVQEALPPTAAENWAIYE